VCVAWPWRLPTWRDPGIFVCRYTTAAASAPRSQPAPADELIERIGPIRDAVSIIDVAARQSASTSATMAADDVISMTTRLLNELEQDHERDPEARAAVVAACGVYRNAAFAFRSLAGVTGEPDPQMGAVVAALIDLGDHHVRSIRPTPWP
jgi:hypothetical protein